jgi:hypothetical protein
VRGPVGNVRLASVAGLTKEEWQAIKPAVLPLLRGVQLTIVESLNYIRSFDGERLPSADWHIVRSIVMERARRPESTPPHYFRRPVSASHIFHPQRDIHRLATAACGWPQRS